ncbi:MAG: hypothetical protein OXG60_14115 [Chloroflexi bacterium]|nr:hypothetical protein [Chloroflexota bacterium]
MSNVLVTESTSRLRRLHGLARPGSAIIALLLALVAGNFLYAHLDRARDPIVGNPGDLLYVATFDGYLDEWDLYAGQQSASIEDGRLRLALSSAQTASWSVARHHFIEFDISVAANAVAGPIDNAFGIVFALQSPSEEACDLPAVIFCGIGQWSALLSAALRKILDPAAGPNYYAFLISSDGYYALERIVDGAREVLSTWIPSPSIYQDLGAQNSIRVIAQGSELKFFVNGEQVMLCIPNEPGASSTFANGECIGGRMVERYQAPGPLQGQLGLIAQATQTGGGGVVVDFDNVTVFSPSVAGGGDAKL